MKWSEKESYVWILSHGEIVVAVSDHSERNTSAFNSPLVLSFNRFWVPYLKRKTEPLEDHFAARLSVKALFLKCDWKNCQNHIFLVALYNIPTSFYGNLQCASPTRVRLTTRLTPTCFVIYFYLPRLMNALYIFFYRKKRFVKKQSGSYLTSQLETNNKCRQWLRQACCPRL